MKRKKTTKISFKNGGLTFKNISMDVNENGEISSSTSMRAVSQVIRQYIKQKYGVPFEISTDSFSMGDSVSVYLAPRHVSVEQYQEIRDDLSSVFQRGNFNGMTDSYEYRSGSGIAGTLPNGETVKFSTKYMSTQHKPKFGGTEWAINELLDDRPAEEIIEYTSQSVYDRAVKTLKDTVIV